jgi:hypothetical protein
MTPMFRRSLLLTAVALSLAGTAHAQAPRTDQRETNQERRIQQGAASGQLNQAEQNRLNRGQAGIDRAQTRAGADGTVTARERRRLEARQDVQSARIARQRHDRQGNR